MAQAGMPTPRRQRTFSRPLTRTSRNPNVKGSALFRAPCVSGVSSAYGCGRRPGCGKTPRSRRVLGIPAGVVQESFTDVLRGCEKMSGIQFRQDGLGMPSPYVVENKRSSVGARHASTVFRAQRAIFSQPLRERFSQVRQPLADARGSGAPRVTETVRV